MSVNDRRQCRIRLEGRSGAGEELSDVPHHDVRVLPGERSVRARQLHQPGARDVVGKVRAVLKAEEQHRLLVVASAP